MTNELRRSKILRARTRWPSASLLAIGLSLLGCTSEMADQGRLKPYEPTQFFADDKSARDLVPGTVPREGLPVGEGLRRESYEGVTELPVPLTTSLLERGRETYEIFCSMCHGMTGHGDGMIVQRGFPPPPSYHTERLREAPIGHFVHVITNGFGAMYSYNDRVPLEDRWAVAAYIRALQLSQHAPFRMLREEEIERAQGTP